jgi:O-antigen/teichoic acid export membrane protein
MTGLLSRARGRLGGDLVPTVLANFGARLAALVGLAVATIVVARAGGPADVGAYALLRMLPGLLGVLSVSGLPGAMSYFLAPARREAPGLWPSTVALLAGGAVLGTVLWAAGAPLLHRAFFPDDSTPVLAAAGVTVATQLYLTVGKTSLQGLGDRRGGDVVIAAEEVAFLPCYLAVLALGADGTVALVLGLGLADVLVGLGAWHRVSRQLGWRRLGVARSPQGWWGRPDRDLTREIAAYGMRGQVGGLVNLLNLRLDFALLGAMAGPTVLGMYAVASKLAELLRLPGTALTWVCYPTLAAASAPEAAHRARRLVVPMLVGVGVAAVPFILLTGPVIAALYGERFHGAVLPAQVLVLGMVLSGASGVASGYLYGRGRPGLNSAAMGVGLVLTAALDLALIPRYGATGAAVASTIAYLSADACLVVLLWRHSAAHVAASESRVGTLEVAP